METIDPKAQFPLLGKWKQVPLAEFKKVMNGEGGFVIEAYLPSMKETAWAYRNPGRQRIEFNETHCIEAEDMTGLRGAELVNINDKTAYQFQTKLLFRFFVQAA